MRAASHLPSFRSGLRRCVTHTGLERRLRLQNDAKRRKLFDNHHKNVPRCDRLLSNRPMCTTENGRRLDTPRDAAQPFEDSTNSTASRPPTSLSVLAAHADKDGTSMFLWVRRKSVVSHICIAIFTYCIDCRGLRSATNDSTTGEHIVAGRGRAAFRAYDYCTFSRISLDLFVLMCCNRGNSGTEGVGE